MRVYELAKELGIPNKDFVNKVQAMGIQVSNHMSVLELVDADRIRRNLIRERQESLEEVRLDTTVIRRRSRNATAPSAAGARAAAARVNEVRPEPPVVEAPPEPPPPVVAARPAPEVLPPPPAPPPPPPPEPIKAVEAPPAPEPEPPAPEPVPVVVAAAPAPAPAPPEPEAPPVREPAAPPAVVAAPAAPLAGEPPAAPPAAPPPAAPPAPPAPAQGPPPVMEIRALPNPGTPPSADGTEPRPRFRQIPQPVVTGSAATGQFIQLPGRGENNSVPRVEIRDRDEELRRLGRGVIGRLPPGQNRFGGRPPGGPGGPGGRNLGPPPRKRQVAAGKKVKQTQITTPAEHKRVVRMAESITVSDLAREMGIKGNEVVKRLWALGMMGININQSIDLDTAMLIANEFGWQVESKSFREEDMLGSEEVDAPEDLEPRAPVVTIMGHVDHGKTSLLDAIRKANVAEGEAGGITQHIGAYKVHSAQGDVTFLDTPGHEAFTAMRARGAKMTDIVVLVVAADDGPMPQTVEAINHAKAAEVPLVVAVNKIDKPDANPGQIRNKMMEHGLVPEEFGGQTIYVDVSAKTKQGIDKLLEMLALQSELLELKANPKKAARGHIVEARLDRNRGPISSVLVESGTLRAGDLVVAGIFSGKVRAMMDDHGKPVAQAGPSTPVEILGIDGVPEAGDTFNVVSDEKLAKQILEHRRETRRSRDAAASAPRGVSLENILDKIREGEVKEVKIVLKADVQGSAEALSAALTKLSTPTVGVNVISSGVGGITESDVTLAKASSAIVIGFNVRPAGKSQSLAEQEGVDIKTYQVIYDAIDDVKKAMVGMLEPVEREKLMGKATVRQVFTIPKVGAVAGCMVTEGKIHRRNQVRLVRDSVVIYTGRLGSLRRFKDDVNEVDKGYECGLSIDGYNDLKDGDVIESFEIEQIAASLDAPIGAPAQT
ncbi:MAG: translation initiation factor IF-2 [Myxococcales bacterium]|nr:translation initiation factor IF-2 [Myxococcales bacterium]